MEYTKDHMEAAYRYQDFATDVLYEFGIPICCYSSMKWNIEKGESRAGVEIKNDNKFSQSGNLYFETHEKRADATEWVESGLLRDDNTTFYFIGDYTRAWLFSKKQLLALIKNPQFERKETLTSKAVVIPVKYFDEHPAIAIKEFNFIDQNMNHIPCVE